MIAQVQPEMFPQSYGIEYPTVISANDDAPRVNADGWVLVKGLGYVAELPTFECAAAAAHVACYGVESWEKLSSESIGSGSDEGREDADIPDERSKGRTKINGRNEKERSVQVRSPEVRLGGNHDQT